MVGGEKKGGLNLLMKFFILKLKFMKRLLLVIALDLATNALQAQTDTLKRIIAPKTALKGRGEYRYGDQKIRNPRRLAPYFYASGDTAVIRLFEDYRGRRRQSNLIFGLGGGVTLAGMVLFTSGAIVGFQRNLFNNGTSNPAGLGQRTAGSILFVGGLGTEILAYFVQRKAYKILGQGVSRYNQGRAAPVSLDVGASSNGAGLLIRF